MYQAPGTLEARRQVADNEQLPIDYAVLRVSRREVASGSEEILTQNLAQLSASYRESAKAEEPGKCSSLSLAVTDRINHDPSDMLEIVHEETAANPSCACEIVKAAIQTTDGDTSKVVAIVETAVTTAPEHLRLISQCAIAAAPESLTEVQALLATLDPGAGESGTSAKSAKSAKVAAAAVDAATLKVPENPPPDPLDLPPFQFISPPIIIPTPVTRVNP
ncbi:MAG: hypothetical protein EOP87_23610 [Verrucomicrobiaceae bacterium]|nr:MAG: hypothetical protein EOP87_23610 [Verrucomicrobiaceae bacterium]